MYCCRPKFVIVGLDYGLVWMLVLSANGLADKFHKNGVAEVTCTSAEPSLLFAQGLTIVC